MDIALGNEPPARSYARVRVAPGTLTTVALWIGSVVVARVWGLSLVESGEKIRLNAVPLFGRIDPILDLAVIPAVLAAGLLVWFLPVAAASLPWRGLLLVAPVAAAAWSVALAVTRGWSSLTQPLLDRHDYLVALPATGDPGFLSSFADKLWTYPIHVQGHPPGMLMLLRVLENAGLAGAGWASVAVIGIGVSTVTAVLVTVRVLADESRARACAPFLVLTPAAVWIATSADAIFMGAAAWAVALMAMAAAARRSRGLVTAVGAGVLAAATAFLSYGAVALATLTIALPRSSRTALRLLVAAGAAIAVSLVFYVNGFSWFDGLAATIHRYETGVSSTRPFGFFAFNNLVAFSLVLGPAVLYALVRLRDAKIWWIAGAALASVLVSNLSGLSKGEVERIWLPFAPWLMVAACAIPLGLRRRWLAAQAALALGIQLLVRTPW
jgi:hypothetical protein